MERDLIADYVSALRVRLAWRPDIDDVGDEVEDHLREHVERLVAAGTDEPTAQRRTLERFGDLALVARSFEQTPSGALAVPTRRTRLAGTAAVAASVAWAATFVTGALGGHTEVLRPWSLDRYVIWAACAGVALALSTLTLAGALSRVGRLRSPAGLVAVAVAAALSLAMAELAWAITLLVPVLGLAVLVALRGHDEAVVRPLRLLGVWLLGGVGLVVFDEIVPVGGVDEYGDHPVVWFTSFALCTAVSTLALALTGRRLRRERPADIPDRHGTPVSPTPAG